MTGREEALEWSRTCTAAVRACADRLDEQTLDEPSALPGWSRRHVLAHLGFNAEAVRRLATWARTGVRTPMYPSREVRDAEIADGATWDAARLRAFLADSADALAADLAALPEEAWDAEVVTAQGRAVPASVLPWMRAKEVAVHAVDLATGTSFADLPPGLCEALVDDVAALRAARGDGPALRLQAGARTWDVPGFGQPVTVRGDAPALAAWLTGRGDTGLSAQGGELPVLGPWL